MSRRLETLAPGTPVFCGEQRVGSVEGIYTEGDSRLPEYLAVAWQSRGETILVPTREVESLEERGVILECSDPAFFETTARFEPRQFPTIKKLA
ncbi:MAG TPA: hypothetical protein VN905_03990 [Candidatus Binatia bacterium]|nr:hypothetical protein [Candidatus Binatia bacterium]